MLSRLMEPIYLCICWARATSSAPKRSSCRHPRIAATILVGEVVGRAILNDLDIAETLAVLQDHIEGLTLGIQDVRTDELPQIL